MRWLTPAWLAAAGALLSLAAAFWASSQSSRHQRELRERADEIAGLNRELVKKNEELVGFTRNTLDWVTGGDSIVYFEPLRRHGRLAFFIRHAGNHPAFDVTVRVHEVTAAGDRLVEGPKQIGTISGGSGMDWTLDLKALGPFSDPPPAGSQPKVWRVEVQTRNALIVQRLELSVDTGGRWQTSSRTVSGAPFSRGIRLPEFKEAQDQ